MLCTVACMEYAGSSWRMSKATFRVIRSCGWSVILPESFPTSLR